MNDLRNWLEIRKAKTNEPIEKHILNEVLRKTIELNKDHIYIDWCTEDIQERAKEIGVKISKKRAREILHAIKYKHDCNIGVTWDVLDCYIQNY